MNAAARAARLSSDLVHLEETCMQDLSVPADELRADEIVGRAWKPSRWQRKKKACRGMKQKLEAMGPVNMMALEEYKEASRAP